jgi:hypothetical protein
MAEAGLAALLGQFLTHSIQGLCITYQRIGLSLFPFFTAADI